MTRVNHLAEVILSPIGGLILASRQPGEPSRPCRAAPGRGAIALGWHHVRRSSVSRNTFRNRGREAVLLVRQRFDRPLISVLERDQV